MACIVAELAEHGQTAKYAIRYDLKLSGQKVLDLTNPTVATKWNYVPKQTLLEGCQNIGAIARTHGYTAIKFQSFRGEGINYVFYNNFDSVLSPKMVVPVD